MRGRPRPFGTIVAAQATMLAVHYAMTAPKPVDRTMATLASF